MKKELDAKLILNKKDFKSLEKMIEKNVPATDSLKELMALPAINERSVGLNVRDILNEVKKEIEPFIGGGELAKYIPALSEANLEDFAMSVSLVNGESYHIGCSDKKFSIQSISKVFLFELLLNSAKIETWEKRLGVEPSGSAFNSMVQLEYEKGIPRNPFINPGAIVVSDILMQKYGKETIKKLGLFLAATDGGIAMAINEKIFKSEKSVSYRNAALINLMKGYGNINGDVNEVLDVYFAACSIMSNTALLSRSVLHLANGGVDPISGNRLLSAEDTKRVNALMLTCGHYDASGDFAFRVGLPGKSGVGGGIVAIKPGKMSVAVYAPGLNSKGNSLVGTKALEIFTRLTSCSVF